MIVEKSIMIVEKSIMGICNDEFPFLSMHRLILEGHGCETRTYASCIDFSSTLMITIRMTEIGRQGFNMDSGYRGGKDGVTVNVTFKESHQVFHTWPECQFAVLEISSRKRFSEREVVRAFKAFFKPKLVLKGVVSMERI